MLVLKFRPLGCLAFFERKNSRPLNFQFPPPSNKVVCLFSTTKKVPTKKKKKPGFKLAQSVMPQQNFPLFSFLHNKSNSFCLSLVRACFQATSKEKRLFFCFVVTPFSFFHCVGKKETPMAPARSARAMVKFE